MKLLNKLNEPTHTKYTTSEYYPYRSYLFGMICFIIQIIILYITLDPIVLISFFSGMFYFILWALTTNRQIKRIREPINKNNMETIEQ